MEKKAKNENQSLLKLVVRKEGKTYIDEITMQGNKYALMLGMSDQMEKNEAFRTMIMSVAAAYAKWSKMQNQEGDSDEK